jgi:hypothetical protein
MQSVEIVSKPVIRHLGLLLAIGSTQNIAKFDGRRLGFVLDRTHPNSETQVCIGRVFGHVAHSVLESKQSARKGRIERPASFYRLVNSPAGKDGMCLGRSAVSVVRNELLFQETGGGWRATGTLHFEDIHEALR